MKLGPLARHILSLALLATSWKYVNAWYLYQNGCDLSILALLFGLAIGFSIGPYLYALIKRARPVRVLLLLILLFFCIPWGEWFRLGFGFYSREDWIRQILTQACLIYVVLLTFHCFPQIPKFLYDRFHRVLQGLIRHRSSVWIPAVLFFLITAWITLRVNRQIPFLEDSAAQLFQARIFSRFQLSAPAPPIPDFFDSKSAELAMFRGRWFGGYTPGYAILLALVSVIQLEWLFSPLLGCLTVAIWIAYAIRWANRKVAFLLGLLLLLSPFSLTMSSTIMIHVPELFIVSAALYLCRAETEKSLWWRGVALCILLILGILVRPFSILVFLFPIVLYSIFIQWKKRSFVVLISAGIGILIGALFLAFYQQKTTGNPLLSASDITAGHITDSGLVQSGSHHYGFGQTPLGEHTLEKSLENISNLFQGMNIWLTGSYFGFLFFLFFVILRTEKFDPWDRVLFFASACLILFYFFYIYQDLVIGPRYYYLLAPFLLWLMAKYFASPAEDTDSRMVTCLLILSIFSSIPHIPRFIKRCDPNSYLNGHLHREIEKLGSNKTILFLDKHISQQYIGWNDPFLTNPVLICKNLESRNQEAIDQFPGYQVRYFGLYETFTKGNYESRYRTMPEPPRKDPGYVSLFQLVLALEHAKDSDLDCFDTTYGTTLLFSESDAQMSYLERKGSEAVSEHGYRKNFRVGILHAGRMLLLPMVAYQHFSTNWKDHLDYSNFRKEYQAALQYFESSGEVGKDMCFVLKKTETKIDKNRDGIWSENEMIRFLNEKLVPAARF